MNTYNQYNENGFTIVKKLFSKKDIDLLKVRIEEFIKKKQRSLIKKKVTYILLKIK